MKITYLFFYFLMTACSHNAYVPKEKLFPYGTYYHDVTVTLKDGVLHFQGIDYFSVRKHALYVLGPLNVTMASYEKEFRQRVGSIFINPEFPLTEGRFNQLVFALNELYSWDNGICVSRLCEKTLYGFLIKIELAPDEKVQRISLVVNDVLVEVKVKKYEKIDQ